MVDSAALTPDCQACANGDANLLTCTGASSASEITNLPKATVSKCFCKQSSIDEYASCFKCPSSVEYQSTGFVSVSDVISACKLYNPSIILIDPTKSTATTNSTAKTTNSPKSSSTLTDSAETESSSSLTDSTKTPADKKPTVTPTPTSSKSNASNTKFNGIRTDIVTVFLLIFISMVFLL
ncbi:hypothetical protein G9A89_005628 [Geosiphon pyriformis]|nr:hypothetical protein G9A89_005628 [Geosiphon pyriformis]